MRTLRLPPIEDPSELETAIRFQAQDHIPMPLEQAVLDWQVVGIATAEDGERRIEVVVVAARRDMLEPGARGAAAGRPATGRHRPLGLRDDPRPRRESRRRSGPRIRRAWPRPRTRSGSPGRPAVAAPRRRTEAGPARLYCNLGDVTNLAVARGTACLFTRVSPFGVEGIAQKLAERRALTLEHARQWLVHVGLDQPLEEIEGETETSRRRARCSAEGARKLADELRLSLEYYAAQEGSWPSRDGRRLRPGDHDPGPGRAPPAELGRRSSVGRPQRSAHLDEPTAARLTVSYGLALEE